MNKRSHCIRPYMLATLMLATCPGFATAGAALDNGLSARQEWEHFLSVQQGEEHRGAEYWAAQRSRHPPGSCIAGEPEASFVAGCREAQRILAPSDIRRLNDPEFRKGWNSFVAPPLCSGIAADAARLACYDTAASRPAYTGLSRLGIPSASPEVPVTTAPPATAPLAGLFHAKHDDTIGCMDERTLPLIRKFPELDRPSSALIARLEKLGCYPVAADLGWSVLETAGSIAWMRLISPAVSADLAIVTMHFDRDAMTDERGRPP